MAQVTHKKPSKYAGKTVRFKEFPLGYFTGQNNHLSGREVMVLDWADRMLNRPIFSEGGQVVPVLAKYLYHCGLNHNTIPVDEEVLSVELICDGFGIGYLAHISELELP
jgi:hypothetical protein